MPFLHKNKWSLKHDKCIKYGTSEKIGKHRYKGLGLCLGCYDKKRAESPRRQENLKRQQTKWYNKNKNTEEYKRKNIKSKQDTIKQKNIRFI